MNFYVDAGILQVPAYHGCQVYALSILSEMVKLSNEHTFHLHFAMDGWNRKIDELLASPNVVPHVHNGPWGRHLAVPLNILRTGSSVFYMMNGNTGMLRVPVPCRSAVLFHDMRYVLCSDIYGEEQCSDFTRSAKQWIHQRDCIVTGSETVKSEIIKAFGIPPERVVVASEAIADNVTHGPEQRPQRLRTDLPYILMVNPGEVRKNWHDVLAAFQIYLDEYPEDVETQLVLAGGLRDQDEPMKRAIAQSKSLEQRTTICGYVSDDELRYLYRHARIAVYPSRYEGFGIPIIEAMSFGVPTIVSDIPVFREVAGNGALFVPLDKPDQLAHSLHNLNSDNELRHQLVSSGHEHIKRYSWRSSAEKTLEMLVRLGTC